MFNNGNLEAVQSSTEAMFMKECLLIAETQNSVNCAMAGDDWAAVAADPSGPINYRLAILDELAEYMRSAIPFKWWAKPNLDSENAIVELVDILHFLTSLAIVIEGSVHKAAEEMAFALEVAGDPETWSEDYPVTVGGTKEEMLRFSSLLFKQEDVSAAELFIAFWRLVDKECGNPILIISMYRAKALLNKFRAANGQKEGKYKKIWFEGREDNSFVMAYLKSVMAASNGEYPGDDALWQYMTLTYPR